MGTPCSRSPGMAAGCWEAAKRALLVTARAVLQPSTSLPPSLPKIAAMSTLHFLSYLSLFLIGKCLTALLNIAQGSSPEL